MSEHKLKTWPSYFADIVARRKTFEIRTNDRDFKVGDTLMLLEFDPDGSATGRYTGSWARVKVTYLMQGGRFGIDPTCCVMAIRFREIGHR